MQFHPLNSAGNLELKPEDKAAEYCFRRAGISGGVIYCKKGLSCLGNGRLDADNVHIDMSKLRTGGTGGSAKREQRGCWSKDTQTKALLILSVGGDGDKTPGKLRLGSFGDRRVSKMVP